MSPTQLLGIVLIAPFVIGLIWAIIVASKTTYGRIQLAVIGVLVMTLVGFALLIGGK